MILRLSKSRTRVTFFGTLLFISIALICSSIYHNISQRTDFSQNTERIVESSVVLLDEKDDNSETEDDSTKLFMGISVKDLVVISLGASVLALVLAIFALVISYGSNTPKNKATAKRTPNAAEIDRRYNVDAINKRQNTHDNRSNLPPEASLPQTDYFENDPESFSYEERNRFYHPPENSRKSEQSEARTYYVTDFSVTEKSGNFTSQDLESSPRPSSYFMIVFDRSTSKGEMRLNKVPGTNFTPVLSNPRRLNDFCDFIASPAKNYIDIREFSPGAVVEDNGIYRVTKKIKIELIEG